MLRLGRCMGLCVAQAIWGLMRSLVVSLPGTLLASRRSAEGLWRSRRELGAPESCARPLLGLTKSVAWIVHPRVSYFGVLR